MSVIDSHTTGQASVLTFDDEGDLRLDVGEENEKRSFIVCSRSLARVSKPFKAMLYGDFAESNQQEEDADWIVELPEDNPEAFMTILRIVHSQFGMISDVITQDELYEITILTEKYNMTDILRPWARKWASKLIPAPYPKQGREVLSWIAWELGDWALFENSLQWMLYQCHLDADSKLCCPSGTPLQDNVNIASLGILDHVVAKRAEVLEALLSEMQDAFDKLVNSMNASYLCQLESCVKSAEECRTFYLGSFIQALNAKGFYPIPTPTSLTGRLVDYRTDLTKCVSRMQLMSATSQHEDCSPQNLIKSRLLAIEARVSLTKVQESHLSKQAQRSGLSD